MKQINSYIIEKFKISKDIIGDLKFPVEVEFWSTWINKSYLEEEITLWTKIKKFDLTELDKKNSNDLRLYRIKIFDRNDLLWLFIYIYVCFSTNWTFDKYDILKKGINNYNEMLPYLESYDNKEYQEKIDEYNKIR